VPTKAGLPNSHLSREEGSRGGTQRPAAARRRGGGYLIRFLPVLTPPVRIQAPVVTAALISPLPTTCLMRGCSSKFWMPPCTEMRILGSSICHSRSSRRRTCSGGESWERRTYWRTTTTTTTGHVNNKATTRDILPGLLCRIGLKVMAKIYIIIIKKSYCNYFVSVNTVNKIYNIYFLYNQPTMFSLQHLTHLQNVQTHQRSNCSCAVLLSCWSLQRIMKVL